MIPLGVVQGQRGIMSFVINQNSNFVNYNMLVAFTTAYPSITPQAGDSVTFNVGPFATFSGGLQQEDGGAPFTTPLPALRTGVWPIGVNLLLNDQGHHKGRGGNASGPNPGCVGGDCLLVESPISIDQTGSYSSGGGGGPSTDVWPNPSFDTYQAGGGGGAGDSPGKGQVITGNDNNASGANATTTIRGLGGNFGSDPNQPASPSVVGGNGGDLGQNGTNASDVGQTGSMDNVGGLAGKSVRGFSLVTWINMGTLVGPTFG